MDILKALTEQGKLLGYEDDELREFVRVQEIQREERKVNREHELEIRQLEISLREKEKSIEEQTIRLQLLEKEHQCKVELLEKN